MQLKSKSKWVESWIVATGLEMGRLLGIESLHLAPPLGDRMVSVLGQTVVVR